MAVVLAATLAACAPNPQAPLPTPAAPVEVDGQCVPEDPREEPVGACEQPELPRIVMDVVVEVPVRESRSGIQVDWARRACSIDWAELGSSRKFADVVASEPEPGPEPGPSLGAWPGAHAPPVLPGQPDEALARLRADWR